MNTDHIAPPVAERLPEGSPYTLREVSMEDFKENAKDILALRREKNMVLNLVSSDGSVIALLPLSGLEWLRENSKLARKPKS